MLTRHRLLFRFVLLTCLGFGAQSALPAATAVNGAVTTVVTFDPNQNQFPEGLAIDKQGNIYVGMYPTGQIWKITPDGEQSLLAILDVSGIVGGGLVGLAVDDDGDLYACDASGQAPTHGIWEVDRNGATYLLAALDPAGFPNAIAVDPNGDLFVTDSYLGEIWKISRSGEARVWLKDPLLLPVLAYGANGIEFDRGNLFVANTDRGTILRIEPGDEEHLPHAQVFVQSPLLVGADGIAFDVRHNLYVAIDYQNTLVRISPGGEIRTLATVSNGLDFPASTSFDQTKRQRSFLFWTNFGVNLNPSLQKMDMGIPGVKLP